MFPVLSSSNCQTLKAPRRSTHHLTLFKPFFFRPVFSVIVQKEWALFSAWTCRWRSPLSSTCQTQSGRVTAVKWNCRAVPQRTLTCKWVRPRGPVHFGVCVCPNVRGWDCSVQADHWRMSKLGHTPRSLTHPWGRSVHCTGSPVSHSFYIY